MNVRGIGAATTVNTGVDDDTIRVGSLSPAAGGTVNGILGRLTVDAGSGTDTLVVDDTGKVTAASGELSATEVTGLGMSSGIGYTGVESVTIGLGGGDDTFSVKSTASGVTTTVNTNGGSDAVTIQSTGGTTSVTTGAGGDTVTVQ